jgi:Protein of unknown function (DUF3180)
VKPTRLPVLLAIAATAAVLAFGVTRVWDHYGTLPGVPLSAPLTLLALAVAVLATALALRNRFRQVRERRPGARPLDPLVAARAAVLAKASSVVGAVFGGLYGGYAVHLLADLDVEPRRQRLLFCGLCVLAAALLVTAALFLERVCRVPPPSADLEDVEDRPLINPDQY